VKAARAVITGLGFITPIGNDRAEVVASLREGRHGFEHVEWFPECPVRVAGTIKGFETLSMNRLLWTWPERYKIARETVRSLSPHGLYAHCALEQAIGDAGLDAGDLSDIETGLFCASAGSPRALHHYVKEAEDSAGKRINPWSVVSSISGTLNFQLAAHHRLRGPVTGFASACAASTHALGYASDEIILGRCRRMLVVGAEEPVWESLLPFLGMRALSRESDPSLASRPFDRARDGFVGSGGAAALVLENLDDARARGASVYAEIAGWGQSSDGYNVAMPEPEGRGIESAARRALERAGIQAQEVDYVNAHATSTPAGDRAEAAALGRLFGGGGKRPLVSSTKGLTGHTLSMSGALETALSALVLQEGFVPGNAGLVETDPDCPPLNLVRGCVMQKVDVILKNSSGFGGSNVCLLLRRVNARERS
jgi:3-oxoacyl-[acyl-carrier-protein] synthase-1